MLQCFELFLTHRHVQRRLDNSSIVCFNWLEFLKTVEIFPLLKFPATTELLQKKGGEIYSKPCPDSFFIMSFLVSNVRISL